ncbi:mobilization protein [Aureibaculum algae]|uniref:Mobilization protein n=1 Tax=Aureibaculum algae TaxID=2584122 RepID=A0A5B7TYC0_9FLAO|nr:MobB family relaxase [Aureibaculum algae]QCX40281.1 mobilization protein [Aureibaculum algae]
MYITITKQTLDSNYTQSVADFVAYLEKENDDKSIDEMEHFFNQYGEEISSKEVIQEIDGNTAKLKKTEPKFYSITVNPSARELRRLQNHSEELKKYTRELMKDYAASFYRENPVSVDDIKYYAKIEHQRTFKGKDKQIQENQSYATKILALKNEIRKIEAGNSNGNIKNLKDTIKQLEKEAPHQQDGKRIVRGMPKEGSQSHIHIIMSRKDMSNTYSLSPGSKYKASETVFNGKLVKRGFDRDSFFKASEKTFDNLFQYKRNYVETYTARKTFVKNPKLYFSILSGLPTNERALAFKLLGKSGVNTSLLNIPTNQVQLALKALQRLKQGIGKAIESGSIGI